jgi:hypothetical protein
MSHGSPDINVAEFMVGQQVNVALPCGRAIEVAARSLLAAGGR